MSLLVPESVKRLVDRFDQDRKVFQSGDCKEEQLRLEFLNPFFTALGWGICSSLDTARSRKWGSVSGFPGFPCSTLRGGRCRNSSPARTRYGHWRRAYTSSGLQAVNCQPLAVARS